MDEYTRTTEERTAALNAENPELVGTNSQRGVRLFFVVALVGMMVTLAWVVATAELRLSGPYPETSPTDVGRAEPPAAPAPITPTRSP